MAKGGKGAGPQFSSLGDMFDGGGAGASGGAFKGHNGFTNAIAAIGNGLFNQPSAPQTSARPQARPMPRRQSSGVTMPGPMQGPSALGPEQGPMMPGPTQWPTMPGAAQGPMMPYPGAELSDPYLASLRMRANQGDASAMEMLQRYDQQRL